MMDRLKDLRRLLEAAENGDEVGWESRGQVAYHLAHAGHAFGIVDYYEPAFCRLTDAGRALLEVLRDSAWKSRR